MKTLAIVLFSFSASGCLAARTETITLDLERPQQPFALTLTEATDSTLSATLLAAGSEFDTSGWTGLLWYGAASGGATLTNSACGVGSMTWNIPVSAVPTNGRYSVQILGVISNRVEEWGRGAMAVRLNPSRLCLPAQWITNAPAYALAARALAMASEAEASISNHALRADNPHGVTAAQLGALTNETDAAALAALAALHATNAVIAAAVTNEAALRQAGDAAALAALAAHAAYWPPSATPASWFTFTTNNNEITITGYDIGGGTDVVIPDYINGWPVTEIGANAFKESGITSIGGADNVVTVGDFAFVDCSSLASISLPQAQTVGEAAFISCYSLISVSLPQAQTVGESAFESCISLASVSLPQVTTIGVNAFSNCPALTSVSLPQATTIGDSAFVNCSSLASVYFDSSSPTIETAIFAGIPANQVTNYVTNPQATGWGATLGGMPVVRPPLYADAIHQAGELVATTGHVAQAIAAIPEPDLSDRPTFAQIAASNALPYTAWTGTITPANGTATVSIAHGNQPVLVIDAPTVLQLDATGFGTSGVSRVSLSYYTGTNALTFATNVISYAETPTVDTNGWNTLLLRRVSNSDWKGVGL